MHLRLNVSSSKLPAVAVRSAHTIGQNHGSWLIVQGDVRRCAIAAGFRGNLLHCAGSKDVASSESGGQVCGHLTVRARSFLLQLLRESPARPNFGAAPSGVPRL